MAALPILTSEAPATYRSGSLVALAAGFLAFTTGVVVLLMGLLLPVPPSDTVRVSRTAVNRAPERRIDAETGVPRITGDPRPFATMTRPDSNNRSDLAVANDRYGVAQFELGILSSDLIQKERRRRKERRLRTCTGANMESTHVASVPLCSDVRGDLMEMAVVAYREPWTR